MIFIITLQGWLIRGWSLFKMIFSKTLLGWFVRLSIDLSRLWLEFFQDDLQHTFTRMVDKGLESIQDDLSIILLGWLVRLSIDLFRLWLEPIQDDLQHNLTVMVDKGLESVQGDLQQNLTRMVGKVEHRSFPIVAGVCSR